MKNLLNRAKRFAPAIVGSSALTVGLAAKNAFAVGVADVGVTTAISGMSDNLVATVTAVAPYGIAIMALILGFRYGKKIFKMVANG